MRETCFPQLAGDVKGVADRYARWGGIPRYVLDKRDPAHQSVLASAIAKTGKEQLLDLCSNTLESHSGVSHRVLHFKVASDEKGRGGSQQAS